MMVVENPFAPITAPIISLIACSKLRYFLLAYVTGSCWPMTALLNGIELKVFTLGGRYLYYLKKRREKKVS